MKKILSILLVLTLIVGVSAGCSNEFPSNCTESGSNPTAAGATDHGGESSDAEPVDADISQTDVDMFTDRDSKSEYDAGKAVTIQLSGTTATASSDGVQINGSTVILKEEATYVISGSLNGMLIVDAPDTAKLQIVLNSVDITSETSAALYILEADKVFVTLADGTANTLANGGSFVAIDDNNIDGALFSKQDLTLNGSGSLTVTSPAGHGIVCKDDLVITGGTYVVNSASHGLDANDSVRIADANITIDAGKDAIHCENSEDAARALSTFPAVPSMQKQKVTASPQAPICRSRVAPLTCWSAAAVRMVRKNTPITLEDSWAAVPAEWAEGPVSLVSTIHKTPQRKNPAPA